MRSHSFLFLLCLKIMALSSVKESVGNFPILLMKHYLSRGVWQYVSKEKCLSFTRHFPFGNLSKGNNGERSSKIYIYRFSLEYFL